MPYEGGNPILTKDHCREKFGLGIGACKGSKGHTVHNANGVEIKIFCNTSQFMKVWSAITIRIFFNKAVSGCLLPQIRSCLRPQPFDFEDLKNQESRDSVRHR